MVLRYDDSWSGPLPTPTGAVCGGGTATLGNRLGRDQNWAGSHSGLGSSTPGSRLGAGSAMLLGSSGSRVGSDDSWAVPLATRLTASGAVCSGNTSSCTHRLSSGGPTGLGLYSTSGCDCDGDASHPRGVSGDGTALSTGKSAGTCTQLAHVLGQAGNGGNGNSSTVFGVAVQLTRLSSAGSAGIGGCCSCSSPMLNGALSHALSVCCLGRGGSLSLLLDGDIVGVPMSLTRTPSLGSCMVHVHGARPVSPYPRPVRPIG